MKLLIAAVALVAVAGIYMAMNNKPTPEPVEEAFANFVSQYRKSYFSSAEYNMRLATFKQNVAQIEKLNREDTATYGINQFSDWTHEEFMKLNGAIEQEDEASTHVEENEGVVPTGSVDWRSKGVLNPVKDQGSCGSCWAFAAVGEHEARWAIERGQMKTLGEQELVDCSRKQGNNGCSGGWHYYAWKYMMTVNGLEQESDYPYTAKDETCVAQGADMHVEPVDNYYKISAKSASLQAELDQHPVAVAVDAS